MPGLAVIESYGGGINVTAVEYDEDVAAVYKDLYPEDTVIVDDAHEYLRKHYKDFDFIWTSPPCPSHSKIRHMASKRGDYPPVYPDMKLYEEIIFLKHFFKGKYLVENVVPYYEAMLNPKIIGRHCLWSNFKIGNFESEPLRIKENNADDLQAMHGFDLSKYKMQNKLKALRNCVYPELGLHIFNCAKGVIARKNTLQTELF